MLIELIDEMLIYGVFVYAHPKFTIYKNKNNLPIDR